jgi:hypothetical protein
MAQQPRRSGAVLRPWHWTAVAVALTGLIGGAIAIAYLASREDPLDRVADEYRYDDPRYNNNTEFIPESEAEDRFLQNIKNSANYDDDLGPSPDEIIAYGKWACLKLADSEDPRPGLREAFEAQEDFLPEEAMWRAAEAFCFLQMESIVKLGYYSDDDPSEDEPSDSAVEGSGETPTTSKILDIEQDLCLGEVYSHVEVEGIWVTSCQVFEDDVEDMAAFYVFESSEDLEARSAQILPCGGDVLMFLRAPTWIASTASNNVASLMSELGLEEMDCPY